MQSQLLHYLKDRPWLAAVLTAALCFAVIYAVFGQPGFETNDDVIMEMVLSGVGVTDTSDPHILYSNYLVGLLLCGLYKTWPALPWYGLYLLSLQFLGLTVIIRLFSRMFSTGPTWFVLLLALVASTRPLLLAQFTTTASLVASAAALCLLFALKHHRLKSITIPYSLSCIALFSLAAMVRIESAGLIMILLLIVLFTQQFRSFNSNKLKVAIITLAASTLIMVGLSRADKCFYDSDPEWSRLYAFKEASWSLLNTERLNRSDARTHAVLDKAGWGAIDIDIFYSWYFLDPQFARETVKQLDHDLSKLNPCSGTSYFLEQIKSMWTDKTIVPLLIVIAVITFWLTSARMTLSMALSVLIALTILSILIMLYAKLPARVYASILQFTALAFALHCSPKAVSHLFSNKVTGATTIAFAGIVVLMSSLWYWDNSRYLADYQRKELLEFSNKLRSEKNRLIIIWTGELPIESIGLFQNPASYFGGLKLVALNSMMNSPIFYHRLAQFGIEDFIRQLDHPAVLLITRDFTMNCIEDYLIDKNSIRPIFEPRIESKALGIRAYKVVFTDDPNRPDTDLSPLCPVPRSEDIIIFPPRSDSGYTSRFMDCVSLSEKEGRTDFRITGRQPRISIKLDKKPQSLDEISHLFVELAVADNIKNNRMLCLWVEVNKQRGQLCFTRLLKDGKLHRYAYDLRKLPFGQNDRITHININPLFQRTIFDGKQFKLGRVGIIKKSSSSPPTASSTAE